MGRLVSTPSSRVSTDTPVQVVSSLDHFVTQWMSRVTVSEGKALNSSQVQDLGSSISPVISNVHCVQRDPGCGPGG